MIDLPLKLNLSINSHNSTFNREITLYSAFTCLLGPNGAGKTHILRAIKQTLSSYLQPNQKVRYISAGRMGTAEQFRSDYMGHYNGSHVEFDAANYGAQNESVRRHQMESINGDIHTLAVRPDIQIKVQERLRKLFNRNFQISWDAGYLKVFFSRLDSTSPYSSGREASGLMHLIGILSALYDDEVKALIIDEPEVSLHPQLQSFLLNEILENAGNCEENKKIIIIATHSPSMLKISKVDDLLSLVFCDDLNTPMIQLKPDEEVLKAKKIKSLIARLGQEHKMALFSKNPLLVEGQSDVIMCNALATKNQLYLEATGCQFLPVVGKDQIPVVYKLMRLLGKEPVILADADAIIDSTDFLNNLFISHPDTDAISVDLIGDKAFSLVQKIHADFIKLVESSWDDVSAKAKLHPYWINGHREDEEKAKKRAVFSTLFNLTEAELLSLPNSHNWKTIKKRYGVLFSLLEKLGFFILKKGAVESYYSLENQNINSDKVEVAMKEMDRINSEEISIINNQYSDLLDFLKFASKSQQINERAAMRQTLLAALAPCMDEIQQENGVTDLNLIARNFIGDKANIFNIERSEDGMTVHLCSRILDSSRFPLVIKKTDDLTKVVAEKLK